MKENEKGVPISAFKKIWLSESALKANLIQMQMFGYIKLNENWSWSITKYGMEALK